MKTQSTEKANTIGNTKDRNINNPIDISTLIRMQLLLRNISQREIKEELDVCDSAISMFIDGKRKSRRFNKWVFENLGIAI